MTHEDLITTLEESLAEKPLTKAKATYYLAGTFCVDYKMEDKDRDESPCILLTFSNPIIGKCLRLLMAKLYLKHKTPRHLFYAEAKSIVDNESK